MYRPLCQWIVLLTFAASCFGQPVLRSTSPVVSSASFRTPGLPGSGIARGSIFSIFGDGLGPTPYVQNGQFPLPTKLAGTSVTVTVAGTSVPALVVLAYRYQVNAILPSDTPAGSGILTVTYNGETSAPAPIEVVNTAFGIYTFFSRGGQAVVTDLNYRPNSIISTLHPGDIAILWGTGLGPITTSDADVPPAGNLPGTVKVHVGNTTATVSYAGRSGCCSGLDQIAFQVPAGVQGCQVPIAVETGGFVSNIATIAVSASGQTCSDSAMGQDLVDRLAAGNTVDFGYVRLESLIAQFIPGSTAYASEDFAYASFSEYTPQTAGLAQYGVSGNYCVAVDCSYGCGAVTMDGTLADSSPAQLDAGSMAIQGQTTASLSGLGPSSAYGAYLNSNISRFLWSGLKYTVSGAGGSKIGAFSASETTGTAGVTLANLTSGQTLPLSGDLTVQWTGGDAKLQNGMVTIGGFSAVDANYSQWVLFQCSAPATAHSFTIPGWILSTLPRSGTGQQGTISYPLGWIWIGQYSNPVTFTAPGLDRGLITDVFFNGFGVYFQ